MANLCFSGTWVDWWLINKNVIFLSCFIFACRLVLYLYVCAVESPEISGFCVLKVLVDHRKVVLFCYADNLIQSPEDIISRKYIQLKFLELNVLCLSDSSAIVFTSEYKSCRTLLSMMLLPFSRNLKLIYNEISSDKSNFQQTQNENYTLSALRYYYSIEESTSKKYLIVYS